MNISNKDPEYIEYIGAVLLAVVVGGSVQAQVGDY